MQGWIKLHRKLLDNPIFTKEGLLQLFIYCLLKANHEEARIIFNNKEEIIGVGQFITGREVLSKDLNVKESTIYKRLKNLEKLGILNIKSNNKFSLVTIVNYTMYQIEESESNSKSNNKVTTKEQQSNTNKNDKNDKNDKNKKHIDFSQQIERYTNDIELITSINDFIRFRIDIKKPFLSETQFLTWLKSLNKHEFKVEVINQSIANGWQGLFELKNQHKKASGNPFLD